MLGGGEVTGGCVSFLVTFSSYIKRDSYQKPQRNRTVVRVVVTACGGDGGGG